MSFENEVVHALEFSSHCTQLQWLLLFALFMILTILCMARKKELYIVLFVLKSCSLHFSSIISATAVDLLLQHFENTERESLLLTNVFVLLLKHQLFTTNSKGGRHSDGSLAASIQGNHHMVPASTNSTSPLPPLHHSLFHLFDLALLPQVTCYCFHPPSIHRLKRP